MAQQSQVTNNLRLRRSFGKIKKIIDIPNLIEIQKRSYDEFLQVSVASDQRTDVGLQGVFKSVFPDQGFQRDRVARVRELRTRDAQVRRRRMPSARHDLRRADQGQNPARDLGRRERPPLDQERQGAGSLLRRNAADDPQRHVHGERHRTGYRLAAPSLARRVLRARQGQDPLDRQALVLGADDSLSRKLDRFRVRPARRAVRADRPPAQVPRHRAAARARDDYRGPAQLLLQKRRDPARRQAARQAASIPSCWRACASAARSRIRAAAR